MTEEAKEQALQMIQNIALNLMGETDQKELQEGLALIESICRHGSDVSSIHEQEKYKFEG